MTEPFEWRSENVTLEFCVQVRLNSPDVGIASTKNPRPAGLTATPPPACDRWSVEAIVR